MVLPELIAPMLVIFRKRLPCLPLFHFDLLFDLFSKKKSNVLVIPFQTLKVEEKVSLFFYLWLRSQDMAISGSGRRTIIKDRKC